MVSNKHLYWYGSSFFILCNENKPSGFFPLFSRSSVSCISLEDFSSLCHLISLIVWVVLPSSMMLLICSLPYPATAASVVGLSEAAFTVSFNCVLSKGVWTKLLDVSLSTGQTPQPYFTFCKVSTVPEFTKGKDEQWWKLVSLPDLLCPAILRCFCLLVIDPF